MFIIFTVKQSQIIKSYKISVVYYFECLRFCFRCCFKYRNDVQDILNDLFFGFTSNDCDPVSVDQSNFTVQKSFSDQLLPKLSRHVATGSQHFLTQGNNTVSVITILQTLVILNIILTEDCKNFSFFLTLQDLIIHFINAEFSLTILFRIIRTQVLSTFI